MGEPVPTRIPVDGPLNTADPESSRPPGTLVDATDLSHRYIGPRPGQGRGSDGPAVSGDGPSRTMLPFNGADAYFHYEPNSDQMTLGLDWTVDLLFQFHGISSGDTTIFMHDGDGISGSIIVSLGGSAAAAGDQRKVKAIVRTSPAGGAHSSAVTLTGTTQLVQGVLGSAAEIHHVRLRRSKTALALIVNGTSEATSSALSATEGIGLCTAGITIGRNSISAANTYYSGYIFRAAILTGAYGTDKRESAYHDFRHTRGQNVAFYCDGSVTPKDFSPYFSAQAADDRSRFHNYGSIGGTAIAAAVNAPAASGFVYFPINLPVNAINRFTDRRSRSWNVVVTNGHVFQKRVM